MQELALEMVEPVQRQDQSPALQPEALLRMDCQQLSTQDGNAARGPMPLGPNPPGGPWGTAAARVERRERMVVWSNKSGGRVDSMVAVRFC